MKHYRGQVFAWDVVNEALDENGNLRDSLWYNQPGIGLSTEGTAYIEQVFRWAHKADPQALLFYNEAEGEGINRKSDAIYAMVKDFKRRRVPIDGVGCSCTYRHSTRICRRSSLASLRISPGSRRSAYRFTSRNWTSLCLWIPAACLIPRT
jgi:GH35 family endo-1,4-beta-xylanase